ncbi:MAG: hypothetical protein E7042_01150 [Lentisphaerae bacterium]|nr:hypothetical protein [Lentisphaerota bacterium]
MKNLNFSNQRGSAMVAVLCLLLTGGVITAAVLSLSKIGTFTVFAHVERQKSMFVAEGVATRVQYLYAADLQLHPSEKLGETDYTSYDYDRFLCDGVKHVIDYYGEKVQFTITDTLSGEDVAQDTTAALNKYVNEDTDADVQEMVTQVKSRISDYVDSDDEARDDSWETTDYEDANQKPLPRNAAMMFREELAFIPDFLKLYPMDKDGRMSQIRLIPPPGGASLTGKPSLFTASARMIRNYCGIEEEKVPEVLDALRAWRDERTLLSDSLDEDMLSKLKSGLAMSESGMLTVNIEAPDEEKRPFSRLVFSFPAFKIAGPDKQLIEYLEWNFY